MAKMLISFFNNDSEMEHMELKFIQTPTPITVEDRNLMTTGDEAMPTTDMVLPILSFLIMMLTLFNTWNFDKNWFRKFCISATEHTRNQTSVDRSHKYVLITGCDRGLGYHTAKRLDSYGFSVIAGCLDVNSENVKNLQRESSDRLQTVALDVTSKPDLDNVKNWMKENMNGELWGVVNNAGVCFVGTPEIMAQQDVEKVMSVNFYGTVNVTKKFLPLIRRSKGRIVNVGSMNSEVPLPFFSVYNASKAAVKQFTESLSYELKDWGVKVSMVAPAAFKTDIITYDRQVCADKWWADADEATQEDYGRAHFKMPMRPSARLKPSDDTTPFTDSVLHALTADRPKHIYRAGQFSALLPMLVKFSPGPIRRYLCGHLLDFTAGQPTALQQNSQNKS